MSQLRVVVHGCGGRAAGFWIPRLLRQPEVSIVGLCDFNETLCHQVLAQRFENADDQPRVFTDPRRMYDATKPDAAVIVTAHGLHDEHCRLALAAGCHVSVEKPMAVNAQQARELARLADASGKVFQVAFNFPYSQRSSGLKQVFVRGEYGRLQSIHASISQPWRSMHQNTWRMDPLLSGGGFLHDTGTHLIQAVLYLHATRPLEVFAHLDNLDCPVDINGNVQIRFDDGVTASMTFCGNGPGQCRIGMTFENGGAEFTSLHGHDVTVWDAQGNDVTLPPFDKSIRHEHNFLAAIRGDEQIRSGTRDGLIVCELLDAISTSAKTGKPVAVAP